MPYRMVASAKTQKVVADKQHVRIKRTEASPRYKVQIFILKTSIRVVFDTTDVACGEKQTNCTLT